MIPILVAAGHRVVAPDLVGFGRSDKPTRIGDYSYARHVAWLRAFVEALDLREIDLICQDWGGLLGLRVVAECPERFARVIASNTGLPDGRGHSDRRGAGAARALREAPRPADDGRGRRRLRRGGEGRCAGVHVLAEALRRFARLHARGRDARDVPGLVAGGGRGLRRALPRRAPSRGRAPVSDARPDPARRPSIPDNRRAWESLARFAKPFLTAFTDRDPVTAGQHVRFQEEIPGAAGQPHTTIRGAGHFVQEDAGPELARIALDFFASPRPRARGLSRRRSPLRANWNRVK